MVKKQGWEKRLADYIYEMRLEPFKRGVHDCAVFAGNCIEVMTGENVTSDYVAKYKNRKEGYDFLKALDVDGLAGIATKTLGEPLPSPSYAMRGDVVFIEIDEQEALGIVDLSGRRAVTVGKDGLAYYPMKHWTKAWKV